MEPDIDNEPEGLDEADGFLPRISIGHYNPKEEEEKINNIASVDLPPYDDADDKIFLLLRVTAPDIEWRKGLWPILRTEHKESTVRKSIAFLQNIVASALQTLEAGNEVAGKFVDDNTTTVPADINCGDYTTVLESLNLELMSSETVHKSESDCVHITVGKNSNLEVLEGFYSLIRALSGLSCANLKIILILDDEVGNFLWEMLTLLRGGGGMDQSSRKHLSQLHEKLPYLLKSLGFRQTKHHLQWENPKSNEFDSLCWSLHGLFRSTDALESPL